MAITSQLVGAIGGGGKPLAATFTGSGTGTRTVGGSGKTYLVTAAVLAGSSSSPTVTANGVTVAAGSDATTATPQRMIATSGPVTITYKGALASNMSTVVVTEATAF